MASRSRQRAQDQKAARPGRTGRRPGKSTTREEILTAARATFAELGFERATIRGIAARSGVDPALVLRYYDSKEQLFQQAIGWPFAVEEVIDQLVDGDPAQLGERLARFIVATWEGEEGEQIVALVRAAGAHDEAARALGEFLAHGIIAPVASALGATTTPLRTAVVSAQLLGIVLARYVLRSGPLATARPEEIAAVLAPELQQLLAPPGCSIAASR